jgi:hypothetical protein
LGIASVIAFLLLVIPGFMFLSAMFVVVPACVVDRLGPIDSMGRSAGLTKGHRWRIFGLILLIFVPGAILQRILFVLAVTAGPMALSIETFVWDSLFEAFGAVVGAVAYYNLRAVKEGIDIERIAAVFD